MDLRAVEALSRAPFPCVTTSAVIIEAADGLCAPAIRHIAHDFLSRLGSDKSTKVIHVDEYWYGAGFDLFGKRADKSWSLTDCISFAVMREFELTDALTADHHFTQAGFNALLPA